MGITLLPAVAIVVIGRQILDTTLDFADSLLGSPLPALVVTNLGTIAALYGLTVGLALAAAFKPRPRLRHPHAGFWLLAFWWAYGCLAGFLVWVRIAALTRVVEI